METFFEWKVWGVACKFLPPYEMCFVGAWDFQLGPRPDPDAVQKLMSMYMDLIEPLISSSGFAALAVIYCTPCISPI